MADSWAFFKGEFVPLEDARVSIGTHAFNYGTGCFEGIRGYWSEEEEQVYLFRLPEHFERLHRSARMLLLTLDYSVDELCEITQQIIQRCGFTTDVYVRPIVYKASTTIGLSMVRRGADGQVANLEDDFCLFAAPFGDYLDVNAPIKCCISAWVRIDDNMIPARSKATGLYINSALAKTEAERNGYDEAIMLTAAGHVSEGTGENLFIVRDGHLVTPAVSENILEGITRGTVIELAAKELGLDTVERPIDRTELYSCDELFLCGTGAQISAVSHLDGRSIGNGDVGPITRQMQNIYFDVVKGRNQAYRHWLTPATPDRVATRL